MVLALPEKSPVWGADLAIVGAGIAGSALAALTAREGRRVVVFEKALFPRAKLCGEFLSPESQSLLRVVGCLDAVRQAGAVPIRRARFTSTSGAELAFSLPGIGLGISRDTLDPLLAAHAQKAGATVVFGADVRAIHPMTLEEPPSSDPNGVRIEITGQPEPIFAPLVVAAWGRRTRLDRTLDRSFMAAAQPYVGFKRHHRAVSPRAWAELSDAMGDVVEIHTVDGGYCGISFVDGGRINVCMLLHQRFLDAHTAANGGEPAGARWEALCDALCRQNRALRQRFEALEPAESAVHAVAQVPFIAKERAHGPVLFIGDAAGVIAPLCGDGQAMALHSAVMLGKLVRALPTPISSALTATLGEQWDRRFRREFSRRLWLGNYLQAALLHRRGADFAIRALRLSRPLTEWLTTLTRSRRV